MIRDDVDDRDDVLGALIAYAIDGNLSASDLRWISEKIDNLADIIEKAQHEGEEDYERSAHVRGYAS